MLFGLTCTGLAGTITVTGSGGSILDNQTSTLEIVVGDSGTILSSGQNVTLDLIGLTHTWAGDVSVSLEHVGYGSEVYAFNRVGRVAGGFGTDRDYSGTYSFNNDFTGSLWAGGSSPIPGGNYFPTSAGSGAETPFSDVWNGQAIAGRWVLRLTDSAGSDTGNLNSWNLRFTTNDASAVPEPATAVMLAAGACGILLLKRSAARRKI